MWRIKVILKQELGLAGGCTREHCREADVPIHQVLLKIEELTASLLTPMWRSWTGSIPLKYTVQVEIWEENSVTSGEFQLDQYGNKIWKKDG